TSPPRVVWMFAVDGPTERSIQRLSDRLVLLPRLPFTSGPLPLGKEVLRLGLTALLVLLRVGHHSTQLRKKNVVALRAEGAGHLLIRCPLGQFSRGCATQKFPDRHPQMCR